MADWHHTILGNGEAPFVWLHGWGQDSTSLTRLATLFKAEGSHRLFDQPGFGQTPILGKANGTADYADSLANQLRQSDTGPAIFIGHSFGGRVSVQMAARHPDLVKAVILIAGAGIPRRRTIGQRFRGLGIKLMGKFAYWSDRVFGTSRLDGFRNRFGSRDYRNAGDLRETFVRVVNENLTGVATTIKAPVLLVYGSDDTETPPEIGRRYEKAIPISRYEELAGFGHLDILTRGAYQCEAVIRAFLEDIP